MEDPAALYAKIRNMVLADAKSEATNVYNALGTQYNVAKVPAHSHDGVDSNSIQEKFLVQNNKYTSFLITDTSETFQIRTITNIKRLSFIGFAANNATNPATKRAIINSEADFGNCFYFAGSSVGTPNSKIGVPIVQGGNYMYVDSTSLTNNRVGASNEFFVRVTDNTSTDVVLMTVDSYQSSTITLTVDLETDWKLQGVLIVV